MKIYLASRYSWKDSLLLVQGDLEGLGHSVTSRWLLTHDKGTLEPTGQVNEVVCARFAKEDYEDIEFSDSLILFEQNPYGGTSHREATRGGRCSELGYATALRRKVYVVGPDKYSPIFVWHRDVIQVKNYGELKELLV